MGDWFSAFRTDSGPTWYGDNRTPVMVDMTTVSIVFIFFIFFAAFLVIFPGIRRQRWSSFLTVVMTLSVGALILVCIHYPSWHVGQVQIYSEYRSYSSERLNSSVGVKVGLKFCNITLRAAPNELSAISKHKHHFFDYNERFHFTEVKSLQRELADSLHLGLPFPILTVVEYLSVDRAGFIWGRMYRLAGHYTCILLWTAFAMWLLQVLLLCLVPAYFSRCIFSVGVCLLLANLIYGVTCPHKLVIFFPGPKGETALLSFQFGWCFWTILGLGIISVVVGGLMRLLEVKGIYQLTTFLQSDFDEVTRSPRRLQGDSRDRFASTASFETNGSFSARSIKSSGSGDALPTRHPKFFAQLKGSNYGASLAPMDALESAASFQTTTSFQTAISPSTSTPSHEAFNRENPSYYIQEKADTSVKSNEPQTPTGNWKSVMMEMTDNNQPQCSSPSHESPQYSRPSQLYSGRLRATLTSSPVEHHYEPGGPRTTGSFRDNLPQKPPLQSKSSLQSRPSLPSRSSLRRY